MKRSRQFLALLAGGIGTTAALLGAPIAAADESGCTTVPGGAGGSSDTVCESPGNSQIYATPNDLGAVAAQTDQGWGGFGGW